MSRARSFAVVFVFVLSALAVGAAGNHPVDTLKAIHPISPECGGCPPPCPPICP